MVGYSRPCPSDGVLDRLHAVVLVLEADGVRAAIVNVDNTGMLVSRTDGIRQRLAQELGTSISRVMLLFTHTHSGPETEGDEDPEAGYRQMLEDGLVRALRDAMAAMRPCKVAWGTTRAPIGVNRRVRGPDGKARMGYNPDGPVDDRIGVLVVSDARTGNPVTLLVTCTAHANVLKRDSNLISGDFPGWTRRLLAEAAGCPVAITIGSAGNVNARWRGSVGDLEHMSRAISVPVLDLLPRLPPRPISALWAGSSILDMGLVELPVPREARQLARVVEHEWGVDAQPWLREVEELYGRGIRSLSLPLEIQVVRINEGFLAGVPMEPFVEAALEVSRRASSDLVFFGGYTNGYYGYLPTAEEFALGGYEVEWMSVYFGPLTGLLMPAEPSTCDRVVEEVLRLHAEALRVEATGETST